VKIILKREVEEGGMPPPGYGRAYIDFARKTAVYYPFPLNWLARLLRELWFALAYPDPTSREREIRKAASQSYRRGFEAGQSMGRAAAARYILRKFGRPDLYPDIMKELKSDDLP
jgi:hypothetical protein